LLLWFDAQQDGLPPACGTWRLPPCALSHCKRDGRIQQAAAAMQ